MQVAREVASLSYCEKKKVGAVAVHFRRIICTGYNGTLPGFDNCCEYVLNGELKTHPHTQHAERNLIAHAAKRGIALDGAGLFVTLAPCIECAKMIIASGFSLVCYEEDHKQNEGIDLLTSAGVVCVNYQQAKANCSS